MSNINERLSARKYDSVAKKYDKSSEGKYTAKFGRIILGLCEPSNGDKVLDVGCGNGRFLNDLSQKAKIVAFGIDISPNMIEICRQRYGKIIFKVASGEKLQFDDKSFDLLTVGCALHHMENPWNFFSEAHRVLKPGGALIIGEPLYPFGLRQFFDAIVSPFLKAGDNKLFSHKQLCEYFTENGFEITKAVKTEMKQIISAKKV
jgi:ubiquinone/menaquinone biosynthesis C-methylase UbiE